MGRVYYKELPLFHLYDSDLTGTEGMGSDMAVPLSAA